LLLPENEIHIWKIPLVQSIHTIETFEGALSQDEHSRSARYHFEKDKQKFIIARGSLRMILGQYLNISPDQIEFIYNDYGKPGLDKGCGDKKISFNLAHSDNWAVCAIVNKHIIGIDIEKIRTLPDVAQIAERFFSDAEFADYQIVLEEHKISAFFNCWTRKEAFIKAIGEGLSHPLDKFIVTLADNVPAKLVEVEDDPDEAANWEMISFNPAPGYIGAVAIRALGLNVLYFSFNIAN